MASGFHFELLTPEAVLLQGEAQEVVAPGQEGYFGVLPKHTYFATVLKSGTLSVRIGENFRRYKVSGGAIQVTPEKVVVCAEQAELIEVVQT